jgi:outer membrane lipopolysaccharide assembly protein LptE/RlpB
MSRLLAAGALAMATGCGYHFAASDTSALPSDVTTIYVAHFDNHTRINGIEEQLQLDIREEISNHKRLVLVDSPAGADLTLSGDVNQETMLPTTLNSVSEPTQYSETVSVDAVLRDNKTNKVLWQTNHMTDTASFSTVAQAVIPTSPSFLQGNLRGRDVANMTDLQVAQTQQFLSQGQMLKRFSRSIYNSMVQGF